VVRRADQDSQQRSGGCRGEPGRLVRQDHADWRTTADALPSGSIRRCSSLRSYAAGRRLGGAEQGFCGAARQCRCGMPVIGCRHSCRCRCRPADHGRSCCPACREYVASFTGWPGSMRPAGSVTVPWRPLSAGVAGTGWPDRHRRPDPGRRRGAAGSPSASCLVARCRRMVRRWVPRRA